MSHYGHRKPLDRHLINRAQTYFTDGDFAALKALAERDQISLADLLRLAALQHLRRRKMRRKEAA